MDYHAVFLDAIERFVVAYEAGELRLLTRADLQTHLTHYCLRILEEYQAERPYKLHCHAPIFTVRERVDIALGDNEVIAELKLEPDYPGLSPEQKPRVFSDDIERDFKRMQDYCEKGVPHCYSIVLDEDSCHLRSFPNVPWRKLNNGGRDAYLLVRHFQA